MDSMKAGNESWSETGQSIQAGFNETATCTGPDIYNSAEIIQHRRHSFLIINGEYFHTLH